MVFPILDAPPFPNGSEATAEPKAVEGEVAEQERGVGAYDKEAATHLEGE